LSCQFSGLNFKKNGLCGVSVLTQDE